MAFSIRMDISVETYISHKIWRWGADACSVFIYRLSVVTASICLGVVSGSFFFSVKASNNGPQPRFVHFLPEYIWVKTQCSNQL